MAKDFNLALLAKLSWQVAKDSEKLWVRVLRDKYVTNGDFLSTVAKGNASWVWRSICKGNSVVEIGMKWSVGNGNSLRFWSDWWVGNKPLASREGMEVPVDGVNTHISDFILPNH